MGAGMASARKRIWGWYFFDWASQPYNTLLLTFIFGPYFAEIARGYYMGTGLDEEAAKASAQAFWGFGLTASSLIVAVLAPVLGAIADGTGRRLVWIWIFSAFYVIGATGLWWVMPGAGFDTLLWAVVFFGIGFIGLEFAAIFANALMPTLNDGDDLGRISGNGFAFGYFGGLLALVIILGLFVQAPGSAVTYLGLDPAFGADNETQEGTRFVGPFTALWYILFMLPFFLWVHEPRGGATRVDLGGAMRSVFALLRGLRFRKSLAFYLASALAYRDALIGIYAFGGLYASNVLGWEVGQIGIFGIIGAVAAVAGSWVGGQADKRFGPKPVIAMSIIILTVVCLCMIGLERESFWGLPLDPASGSSDQIFYICGALIGAAGGPLQAASRTMLLRHTTPDRATETFGIFALSGKVASMLTPLLVAIVSLISQNPRMGIAPIILLFLVGLFLLSFVKPKGEMAP
jgi:MFS transporter, UMF1 family